MLLCYIYIKYYCKIINNYVPEYYDTFSIRTDKNFVIDQNYNQLLNMSLFVKKSLKYQLYNLIDNTNVLANAKTHSYGYLFMIKDYYTKTLNSYSEQCTLRYCHTRTILQHYE